MKQLFFIGKKQRFIRTSLREETNGGGCAKEHSALMKQFCRKGSNKKLAHSSDN
jgi:hypothetical protein